MSKPLKVDVCSPTHLHILFATLVCLVIPVLTNAAVQERDPKAQVIRIENSNPKKQDTGAGFIVKIKGDDVYIVTASHVIADDPHPRVYFFHDPYKPFTAEVINREEDELRGLALIKVSVTKASSNLIAFVLAST
ncbi:MAG TPA: hypothetical protein VN844_02465, partial [Pyrinomonadaceae bacterium]|nr:hypothetical protein [Pyrinomonadaceae bacterium]